MGNLSASLNIAVQSMLADETALNVTSNNIANANTAGYSQQVAELVEAPPVDYGGTLMGNGVEVAQVVSQRSSILQLQLDQQTSQQDSYTAYLNTMQQVQTLFNETSGTGLQSSITNFFNSLQQLSTDPTNTSLRSDVISAAQSMTQAFNTTASQLTQQQQNLNLDVQQSVSQVNTLTSQIAALNQQIVAAQNSQQDDGTLLDQRSQLVNQLSGQLGIQEINASDGSLTITTSNGAALVVGNQSFGLTSQLNASTGNQDVISTAEGTDITSQITGGALGGDIEARDTTIPSIESSLDDLAGDLESSFNSVNEAGTDLNGNPGTAFFSTPAAGNAGAAANMSVAITDPSQIAASLNGTTGDNSNITAMLALQNDTIVNGQTPMNAYSSLVDQVGNDVSSAQSESTASQAMITQLQNLIGGISGVSVNEQAAQLVQYQQAYEAAAQVASVMEDLIGVAIDLGQTTTVTTS